MIEVSHITKAYSSQTAVQDISLSIKSGEFYGLLGPNGAGKTTSISIMSSVLQPDSGSVRVAGKDIAKHPKFTKKNIGVVPQEIALYKELSAYENLVFWGSLYGVPKSLLKTRISEVLHLLGLYQRRSDKVSTYSGGMKRRINIAAALLHQPKVLFMDEPTVGIDPQSRNLIFEVLEQLHHQGLTIIYTTHYMEEAERLCDRIGIIDQGKIIAEGTLEELKSNSAIKEVITISFTHLSMHLRQQLQQTWPDLDCINDTLNIPVTKPQSELAQIIKLSQEAHADITQIELHPINLERVFLSLTGKQLRD